MTQKQQAAHPPKVMDHLDNHIVKCSNIFLKLQGVMHAWQAQIISLTYLIVAVLEVMKMSDTHTDNSAASPRTRAIRYIQETGSLSTLQARRKGICHIGMRICELRKSGYPIVTLWTNDVTQDGSVHRVALYVLRPKKQLSLPGMESE